MGLWDSIKSIGSDLVDGLSGGLLDFGGKFAEDMFIGDSNAKQAFDQQKGFYKNRYQWMMKDMAKAGLNPILAAGSAGFNTSGTPSVNMATLPQSDYSSAYLHMKEGDLFDEKEATERVEQMKKLAETKTELMRKYEVRNNARLASAQETKTLLESQRLMKDIQLIAKQVDLTDAQIKIAEKNITQLTMELKKLGRYSDVYDSGITKILAVIRAIADSLGLSTVLSGSAAKFVK